MTRIIHMEGLAPKNTFSSESIIEVADEMWFKRMDELTRRKALKIFRGAKIAERRSAFSLETVFSDLSFEEKNNLYKEKMISYGKELLSNAIKNSGIDPKDIDYLITSSCTGFMIPSVDAYLVNELGLRGDVIRLPVIQMGCAGGTSGLIYANEFLKSNPGKTVVLLTLEIPSITFQKNDFSMENLVSTAIFADGFSCAILKGGEGRGAHIVDTDMYHFKEGTHLMGFDLTNSGLKIILDKDVPDAIEGHFEKIFLPFLKRNNVAIEEIEHYMFHPGGKKIINMVENYISKYGKDVSESRWVLEHYGNMSSATILHIYNRVISKRDIKVGDKGYMLAFGPGFMAQSILLEWK